MVSEDTCRNGHYKPVGNLCISLYLWDICSKKGSFQLK